MSIDSKNYTRVFGGPGMPFITSYMFAYYYGDVNFLITWKNNLWTAFLKKEMLEQTLDDGLKFYSDDKQLNLFKNNYNKHYKESLPFFDQIVAKKELLIQEVEEFFKYAGDVLSLYVKCEFFYTDRAFEVAAKDSKLKSNLADFDQLKNLGKEQIIKVFFDANSYIFRLLKILSQQFSVPFDDLVTYTPEEIILLFDANIVDFDVLEARKDFYILKSSQAGVEILTGAKYSTIIDQLVPKIKAINVFKGKVANKAKVKGKVKLFNHGYQFDKVPKLIEEMEQGDVLVTETTSPELMPACKKASAIVTNEGGLLSHAAIVSRELNIPCIVGAQGVTSVLRDG
ncbi:hypothetical protein K8R42_01465, partial [bacterium]|nr:hypothetical protein [bacterium]